MLSATFSSSKDTRLSGAHVTTPNDRALAMIEQRDKRIANQIKSINRLLDEWRTLQDWVSEQTQRGGQEYETAIKNAAYQSVLDQMASIRIADAKGDENSE